MLKSVKSLINFVAGNDEAEIHVTTLSAEARYTGSHDIQSTLLQVVTLIQVCVRYFKMRCYLVFGKNNYSNVVVDHLSQPQFSSHCLLGLFMLCVLAPNFVRQLQNKYKSKCAKNKSFNLFYNYPVPLTPIDQTIRLMGVKTDVIQTGGWCNRQPFVAGFLVITAFWHSRRNC